MPATGEAGAVRQRPFGRGTLGRQLLLRVVLIVAGIAVLLSSASVLATQRVLMSNADSQLDAVVARQMRGPSGQPADNLLQPGQPVGTLYALYLNGHDEAEDSGVLTTPRGDRTERTTLRDSVTDRLDGLDTDRSHHTVLLPGLGRYRVAAYPAVYQVQTSTGQVSYNAKLVVGISLTDVDRVLTTVLAVSAFSFLLAVVGAVIAVQAVVKRSLRPLNRVASTAQQVSQLQLDRGEVALAMRVPESDADPVSEVGRVGQALNHLLDNVDGALAARPARRSSSSSSPTPPTSCATRWPRSAGTPSSPGAAGTSCPPTPRTPSAGWSPRPPGCRDWSRTCCCWPGWIPAPTSRSGPWTRPNC
jgi:two-component system OmpR family sensor kinase